MAEQWLRDDLARAVGGEALLDWGRRVAAAVPADAVYRAREGRRTVRLLLDGRAYFLKYHGGIGWGEICKNLSQLRLPILGAGNEYRAVNLLRALGVDTMTVAAYARAGLNPARQRSLIVTDELTGTVSLEDYCRHWRQQPPPFALRQKLIRKVADSARRMHEAGINHRDFYLCHFHLDPATLHQRSPRCHIIDLHRAQLRDKVPKRWLVKDLAGLYFSAMDIGLTQRDLLRFLRHYLPGGLRQAAGPRRFFWRSVHKSALALYRKDHGTAPPPGPWERQP
ncbi:lipopolysaccharide core heptose(I) kinase RfaP [Parahaliea mediterranea]|uniref:lipopolysaccharide core heptose(I) kinase RfaP n=1 Tax=Parahaliea mediterranea TaxID=651086 RepID=UPI0019D4BDDA|nr:lipopolysaccharide core heptose(I) kinase RfaP [Parahaliea mediterranea]